LEKGIWGKNFFAKKFFPQQPPADKRSFIGRWFLFCLKVLTTNGLADLGTLSFDAVL
jgi:hypothetical protein